jgi:hypothetical protein
MQSLYSYDTLKVLFNISTRYLLFTGSFYLFFYVSKKRKYWYSLSLKLQSYLRSCFIQHSNHLS